MPDEVIKIIYGDGTNTVRVTKDQVRIQHNDFVVPLSREAFREIVIGWVRLLDQEEDQEG